MKFNIKGTVTLDVSAEFEADSWLEAQEQVAAWETWNRESLLDFMKIDGSSSDLNTLRKIK